MPRKISIVTVHKGPIFELKRTLKSIYPRLNDQVEHIVVARVAESEISALREYCSCSKLVINKDKSLYDAMNIGLRHSEGQFINFINSGDKICAPIPSEELAENTCHLYFSTLDIEAVQHVSSSHVVNHQNFLAPNDDVIHFEEKYGVFADAHWMNQMITKYGAKRFPRQYAIFHYGGLSTRPTLQQARCNIRFDTFFPARVKLLVKALFVSVGLERINKYLLRRNYR